MAEKGANCSLLELAESDMTGMAESFSVMCIPSPDPAGAEMHKHSQGNVVIKLPDSTFNSGTSKSGAR